MQRQLDTGVTAFGEQNKDKIVAVPSNKGQGVHLHSDPERSLSPDPNQADTRQSTDSTEDVVVIDDSDSGYASSDLGSDTETIAPNTPLQRRQDLPSSHLDAPKAPRHITRENSSEGIVDSSSSVHDSLALIAERSKALKACLEGDVEGRRHFLEHEDRNMLHQAMNDEERIAIIRWEYERRNEQFRRENAKSFAFSVEDDSDYFSDPLSPGPFGSCDLPQENSAPTIPQGAGPSRLAQRVQEDRKRQQHYTLLNHYINLPVTASPGDKTTESAGEDGHFIVVARRVKQLGPNGTVVVDHETGGDKMVTKCYQVREEELHSIDGDGDSVMGSDD